MHVLDAVFSSLLSTYKYSYTIDYRMLRLKYV